MSVCTVVCKVLTLTNKHLRLLSQLCVGAVAKSTNTSVTLIWFCFKPAANFLDSMRLAMLRPTTAIRHGLAWCGQALSGVVRQVAHAAKLI